MKKQQQKTKQKRKNNNNILALILTGLHGPSVNDSNCHFAHYDCRSVTSLFLAGNSGRRFKKVLYMELNKVENVFDSVE